METIDLSKFKEWLEKKGTRNDNAISDALSRVKRIMKEYNIDGWYQIDQCKALKGLFEYPRQAKEKGLKPLANISFSTPNLYEGIQSLKDALKLYIEYLDSQK